MPTYWAPTVCLVPDWALGKAYKTLTRLPLWLQRRVRTQEEEATDDGSKGSWQKSIRRQEGEVSVWTSLVQSRWGWGSAGKRILNSEGRWTACFRHKELSTVAQSKVKPEQLGAGNPVRQAEAEGSLGSAMLVGLNLIIQVKGRQTVSGQSQIVNIFSQTISASTTPLCPYRAKAAIDHM